MSSKNPCLAKAKTVPKTSKLTPTSSLPFAANVCDVPYLDLIENGAQVHIDKMAERYGADAPAVQFADQINAHNRQLWGWVAVLKAAKQELNWAYRGGSPDKASAVTCFFTGRSMLDLAIGQIELMAEGAGSDLDDFCNVLDDVCQGEREKGGLS